MIIISDIKEVIMVSAAIQRSREAAQRAREIRQRAAESGVSPQIQASRESAAYASSVRERAAESNVSPEIQASRDQAELAQEIRQGQEEETEIKKVNQDTGVIKSGAQPKAINAYNYSGVPKQEYKRPLGESVLDSAKKSLNIGIIGSQGLKAYTTQAFFTPFQYTTSPLAESTIGSSATSEQKAYAESQGKLSEKYSYGLGKTLPAYADVTYGEFGEAKKKQAFESAGLKYTGEPVSMIPQRVGEQVVRNIKPSYQERVNKGEDVGVVEKEFNQEVQTEYSKRIGQLDFKELNKISAYESKIYEPGAYPVVRSLGRSAEAGALTVVTLGGGSVATIAASTYLGAKTMGESVGYAGEFKSLDTKGRVLGGLGIGLGAVSTIYLGNLGVKRFYSEWRTIIYEDLVAKPAVIRGKEVLKTNDMTRFSVTSVKQTGSGQSVTNQQIDVYSTGNNRVGFYGKGTTKTMIYDPQYEKLVSSTTSFSTSGYIPNIDKGVVTIGKGREAVGFEDSYVGAGKTIYTSEGKIRNYGFLASSQEQDSFYNVASGSNPKSSYTSYTAPKETINLLSPSYRSNLGGTGKIFKLPESSEGVNFVTTTGAKSSPEYFQQLYAPQTLASASAPEAQNIGIKSLISSDSSKSLTSGAALMTNQSLASAAPVSVGLDSAQSSIQRQRLSVLPSTIQTGAASQRILLSGLTPSVTRQGLNQRSEESLFLAQPQAQIPKQSLTQKFITPFGLLAPGAVGGFGSIPPTASFIAFPPIIPLGLEAGIGGKVVKGGKRVTSYSPSFSALVFNLKGSYVPSGFSGSGIDFRPITKGFRFNTGLNFRRL